MSSEPTSGASAQQPRPRRWLRWVLILCVALVVAAPKLEPLIEPQFGSWLMRSGDSGRAENAGADQPLLVEAVVVDVSTLRETVSTTGTLLAHEHIDLQAEVAGRIVSINFNEGEGVSRGELLVKLNDADLQATRAATQRQRELASRRERRAAELLEQNFLRQEDYDEALSQLQVLEAEIELTDARIARTEIRAPFDGIAGLRYVSEGAVVGPQTDITTLQSTDSLKVEFAISEKYAGRVHTGDTIEFSVAGSDTVYSATVYARDPRIDTVTRTLTMRAVCENRDGRLLPGAFASVTVTVAQFDAALLVPATALIPERDGAHVLVYADGRTQKRPVATGLRTESQVQILHGLLPGDIVITSGLLQLSPGAAVRIRSATRAEAQAADQRTGS